MITKVSIQNYRVFKSFTFDCREGLNIIVGNNDAGKSTILEAIHLALTKKLNGRYVDTELSPHLFNRDVVREYVQGVRDKLNPTLPTIRIELCLNEDERAFQELRGTNNIDSSECVGVGLEISFDDEYRSQYQHLISDPSRVRTVPIEYYKVFWYSFAFEAMTARSVPIRPAFVDATTIRLQAGSDHYLQSIINDGLSDAVQAELAVAYRHLKEHFAEEAAIKTINERLGARQGHMSDKTITVGVDLSQKGNWEASLTQHVDDIPFTYIGKGEQSTLKLMFALDRDTADSHVILIEEPENHLSFSRLNTLLRRITEHCDGKQLFVTTHSAYVLNKLGIGNVVLLNNSRIEFLTNLPANTQDYFRKMSGYDTLRLLLAKRSILVEGPSDDLVVQKAYLAVHKRLPIEDGVDVINVRGLSFARFLDIAKPLGIATVVVTDNDGDYAMKITAKYAPYICSYIRICADQDNALRTLE